VARPTGQPQEPDFRRVADLLRRRRGLDITRYKASCVTRRVWTRVRALGLESLGAYADHLTRHPEETDELMSAVTINVTEFFRNPTLYRVLEERVLPELLESGPGHTLRVWCPGCSTGEEVYSLALLVHRLTAGRPRRAVILGTDIDRKALETAERGVYAPSRLEAVPEAERRALFRAEGEELAVGTALRRLCRFQRANLLRDEPPRPTDLVVCRNLLIFLDTEEQERVFETFHRVLPEGGYLVLGAVERVSRRAARWFEPVDPRERIYRHLAVA
jgi:chemotaxis methyl-accepting protein methylase